MLNIEKKSDNGKVVLTLEGRLDTITSPDLEQELMTIIPETKELVLDFEKLDYLSSAGLRVLLAAQKVIAGKGAMKLIHVNEPVQGVFEVTGFADILTIE